MLEEKAVVQALERYYERIEDKTITANEKIEVQSGVERSYDNLTVEGYIYIAGVLRIHGVLSVEDGGKIIVEDGGIIVNVGGV
jgi:hypothetical protein